MSVDKPKALRACPLFELLSSAEIDVLAELSKPHRYAPGEVIFAEGEVGAALFVLAEGEVEVVRSGRPIAVVGAPGAFGEMSLIDREQRSATVRARTACTALQLTAENFAAFRKHSRDGFTLVVVNIARLLSSRLRETNARLAERL